MDRYKNIFINGITGYMGGRLAALLARDGHHVTGLCRDARRAQLPAGCTAFTGNALDASTFAHHLAAVHTVVHLVGVSHPSPGKAELFQTVDVASVQQLTMAVKDYPVHHIVYVSVSHPAPLMQAYQQARIRSEQLLQGTGIPLSILRPWYVLGPGHRWAAFLKPLYALARLFPSKRDAVNRMELVTIGNMLGALRHCVDNPPDTQRIMEIPEIRGYRV